jgi:hypothetical protein
VTTYAVVGVGAVCLVFSVAQMRFRALA